MLFLFITAVYDCAILALNFDVCLYSNFVPLIDHNPKDLRRGICRRAKVASVSELHSLLIPVNVNKNHWCVSDSSFMMRLVLSIAVL